MVHWGGNGADGKSSNSKVYSIQEKKDFKKVHEEPSSTGIYSIFYYRIYFSII